MLLTTDLKPWLPHEILWILGLQNIPSNHVRGWCSEHGAAINSATPWPARNLYKGPARRLPLGLQHYHPWNPHRQTLSLPCLVPFVSGAPASCVTGVSMCGLETSRQTTDPGFTTGLCPLLFSFYMSLCTTKDEAVKLLKSADPTADIGSPMADGLWMLQYNESWFTRKSQHKIVDSGINLLQM